MIPAPVRLLAGTAAARLMPVGMRGRNWLIGFTAELRRSIAHVNTYFDRVSRAKLLAPVWQSVDVPDQQPEVIKSELCDVSHSPLQQATRADFMTYLCDDILVKVDRASMLTSLEVRAPWLDHRIVDFAFGRVPDALRATTAGRKILLRHLGRRLLPRELDLTRKQGFSLPLDTWFRGQWGSFIKGILQEASRDIFDRKMLTALWRGQHRGYSNTQRLFSIVMFELWRRTYAIAL
jgi:asparagine synthase (glutamine-hydrolysing)